MMMRQTKQRQAVIQVLRSAKCHPDAFWIHNKVKEIHPNISLGTIYRTLNILTKEGILTKIQCNGEASKYDFLHDNHDHYHAICKHCGAIFDVEMKSISLPKDVFPDGFLLTETKLEFIGTCSKCNQKNTKNAKK